VHGGCDEKKENVSEPRSDTKECKEWAVYGKIGGRLSARKANRLTEKAFSSRPFVFAIQSGDRETFGELHDARLLVKDSPEAGARNSRRMVRPAAQSSSSAV
jgi:hypothetical protein